MDEIGTLANQNFLEWESRLKHIDEMLGRANALHADAPEGSEMHLHLTNARKARDEIAVDLTHVRDLPESALVNTTNRMDGLKTSFEAIGRQLEKLLATVFNVA
jgi:hypothetical protein